MKQVFQRIVKRKFSSFSERMLKKVLEVRAQKTFNLIILSLQIVQLFIAEMIEK